MSLQHKKSMHVISRVHSFSHAINGLLHILKHEPNVRIHFAATIVAVTAGFIRHLNQGQWIAIIFAIGLVWVTEALNTCIEILCNIWCENEPHPEVKTIKDIAAGAVLVSAAVSVIIGVIVFFF